MRNFLGNGAQRYAEYRKTDKHKAAVRKSKTVYRSTKQGKAVAAAYARLPRVKARAAAYAKTERGREGRRKINTGDKRRAYMAEYRRTHPELIAAKRFAKAMRDNHVSRHATPKWADRKAIASFYAEAKRLTAETGRLHVVDHIVPLQGRNVCGLHVQTNLRVVTSDENLRKNNRLDEALAIAA